MSTVSENQNHVNDRWTEAVKRYAAVKEDLSVKAMLNWLDDGAGQVAFTQASRSSLKSAMEGIMDILNGRKIALDTECIGDVRLIYDNIDMIYDRVVRARPTLIQPQSYRTRPLLVIREFLRWAESPSTYKPRKAFRNRTTNGNGRTSAADVNVLAKAPAVVTERPKLPQPSGMFTMPLTGGRIFSYAIPEDLTEADVSRIHAQLSLLVEA